ncbi:hypothetical protein [Marinifilum sp.]|uniref:hypothetical protein n=1 Tax=Marinifilum sp. TaxID=2033137 RepID=UPI003BABB57C
MGQIEILPNEEKKNISIMGHKSVAFVDKVLELVKQAAPMLGGFIDLEAFDHDV